MRESFTMRCRLLAVALVLGQTAAAAAQGGTFKIGTTPTLQQQMPADSAIGEDGEGLPLGRGTAKDGARTFVARGCARCHGANGREGPAPVLIGLPGEKAPTGWKRYPFVPSVMWSWINQMMPLDMHTLFTKMGDSPERTGGDQTLRDACCLKPDEVYGLTAYLLYSNGLIGEDEVMDATSLLKVQMPNRKAAWLAPPFLDAPWKAGLRHADMEEYDTKQRTTTK